VKNIDISSGPIAVKITITVLDHPDLAGTQAAFSETFSGLRKAETQAVYRICQAQAWRERRRLRELEELRAKLLAWEATRLRLILFDSASALTDSMSGHQRGRPGTLGFAKTSWVLHLTH
jgi:hypothetical protein